MHKDHIDRALEALFGSDTESAAPGRDAAGLPDMDERVELLLRAVHGTDREFTQAERAQARHRIIDAMASDIVAEIALKRNQHRESAVDLGEEAGGSSTVIQFPSQASPPPPPPASLRFAALSGSGTSGPADAQMRPSPEEADQVVELIGRIAIGTAEIVLHRQAAKVVADLPPGRKASMLHLGSKECSLSESGLPGRYLVDGLAPGVAKRFVLNQAEHPAEYRAWLS